MDLISGLRSELFRPLVTLIVPGAIAVAPFVLIVQSRIPAASAFWNDHPAAFVSAFLTVVVATGLVLEDVGARIEESAWDRLMSRKDDKFSSEWRSYLRLRTRDEVVAQRYLRAMLTRMKFELATAPALIVHVAGLNWANRSYGFFTKSEAGLATAALTTLAIYLLFESYSSAKALALLRRDVIAALDQAADSGAA